MATRIPATVITGFLGAGKTSLIRHLLQESGGRRLALIINEFGDLGVDREILVGCGVRGCEDADIVELANGCLCCTVADDFLPTIQALLGRPTPPDHILIETSGLALPKPLVKAFGWPDVRTRVTVDGVVAVVDCEAVAAGRFAEKPDAVARERAVDLALAHDNPLEELFEEQLQCADIVLLNKTDRVPAAHLATVLAQITPVLRPGVKTLHTAHSVVDPRVVLGLAAAAEDDLNSRLSHHEAEGDDHDHDDFTSFVVALPAIADPGRLEARVQEAIARHDILRVKGFVAVDGKPMRHVIQAVGGRLERYYDRPWRADEARRSALVVIGKQGLDRTVVVQTLGGTL